MNNTNRNEYYKIIYNEKILITKRGNIMPGPSIYIYIIFFVLLFYLIKEGYWKNIFREIFNYFCQIKRNVFIAILAVTVTVILFDLPIKRFFTNYENPLLDPVARFGNKFGKGEVHFSILLVLIIIFMIFENDRLKSIFSISLMSSVFSGITVDILKAIFTRARPVITTSPYKFFVFIEAYQKGKLFQYEYLSMPSGHTITVVAAIVPLYLYFKNKYIKFGLIILAMIPAFSRLYVSVHWASDVLTGFLLGSFLAKVIYDKNKERLQD